MTEAGNPLDWQAALARVVMDPVQPAPGELALPPSGSLRARLAVYRNNAVVPLVQALEDTLPACRHLLGRSLLRQLLLRFVRTHPPASPVLQHYGDGLPEFLHGAAECRLHPAASELARLELLVVRSWHAADATLVQPADFSALLTRPGCLEGLRTVWHPAAFLLASPYPVGSLWLAALARTGAPAAGADVAPRAGTAAAPGAPAGGETVLVTRGDWAVQVRLLDPAQATMLASLRDGRPLGEALAAALETGPSADPAALLVLLVDGGFASGLAGVETGVT